MLHTSYSKLHKSTFVGLALGKGRVNKFYRTTGRIAILTNPPIV